MADSTSTPAGATPAAKPASTEHSAIGVTEMLAGEFVKLHGKPEDKANDLSSLEKIHEAIHNLPVGERQSALCLSGGGIRSASFALGVMQGLAKAKILTNFHYLSTVSGGGYIGAWLSVWRNRIRDDGALMTMMSSPRKAEVAVLKAEEARLNPPQERRYKPEDDYKEPVEITVLREHSNFLTPQVGAMSADTWTLIAMYLRNLLLNWTVYVPLIFFTLLIPMLSLDVLKAAQRPGYGGYHHYILILAIALFVLAVYTSVRGRLSGDNTNRVTQNAFLLLELIPIYAAASLVCIYSVGECNAPGYLPPPDQDKFKTVEGCWRGPIDWAFTAYAGAAVYLAGWLAAFLRFGNKKRAYVWPSPGNPIPAGLLWLPWTIAGGIAGALVGLGLAEARRHIGDPTLIVVFGVTWISLSIFLANGVYLGLTSLSHLGDVEREWLARSSGWFVAAAVVWGGFAALVLYSDDMAKYWQVQVGLLLSGGIGAAAAKAGSSAKTLASLFKGGGGKQMPMSTLLALGSVIFLVALVIVLSCLLPHLRDWVQGKGPADKELYHPARWNLYMALACLAFGAATAYFINVNRFSAHSLYRNRLIRAFIGAGRGPESLYSSTSDPFTGFDRGDNIFVKDLVHPPEKARLFPVINMALNTVAGSNNAWQERKAETFTVTPLRSGNEWVKYWPTSNYGSREKGLSLGTAIAISGAAASPNMGYHSSPLVGLVMTLFNVRLGWWLGNPSRPWTAPKESPPFGMIQFIQELFGMTKDTSSFVYLSDGGHFENLGLYEMVRRRNHFILVSDAGADPDCGFEDLGNAVRKIQIDLGVKISFKKLLVEKRVEPGKKKDGVYCAVGTIKYPESDTLGHLLYLKPGFFDTEPADVRAYAAANATFPHETTADQFFSESQFESYRNLGEFVINTVLGDPAATPAPDAPVACLGPYWAKVKSFA